MKRLLLIGALLLILMELNFLFAQPGLLTRAESSNFTSTSDYNDVMSFIKRLDDLSGKIRIDTIAESANGMSVPLIIIGEPLPPESGLRRDDNRLVIYIQANIHAGEVEGKEASLMFARDLLSGKDQSLLKDLVILICPSLNPDGNEKIDPLNRAYQNG
ncbi:MAG TPA: M14 family zinc carboxypeptidase, partial [Bacteroidales bacterium]|nr:M14 family zinc carboxypeptidase [Bacteroidales bacterium]